MALNEFQKKWRDAITSKNTTFCARINSPEWPDAQAAARKEPWTREYLEIVGPYCVALLTVPTHWEQTEHWESLYDLHRDAAAQGILSIEDMRYFGNNGYSAVREAVKRGAHALIVSSSCASLEQVIKAAHEERMGIFITCLINGFEFLREKEQQMRMRAFEAKHIFAEDRIYRGDATFVRKHIWLADQAYRRGADGIVCSAPGNYASEEDVRRVAIYAGQEVLALCPEDSGNLPSLCSYVGKDRMLVATNKLHAQGYANCHAKNESFVKGMNKTLGR
jgi:hypothetical protein